jgi:hypothetical protein
MKETLLWLYLSEKHFKVPITYKSGFADGLIDWAYTRIREAHSNIFLIFSFIIYSNFFYSKQKTLACEFFFA